MIPENAARAFGLAMRERRTQLGVSQEEFGQMCGLDRTYIGGVERGERNLSLRNIVRIARALSIRPRELIARAEELASSC